MVFCLFCFNLNHAFAQPANDLCVDAEEITIDIFGSGFRSGNTSSATTTDAPADCGVAVENNDVGGLWYTFTGTGANQLYTFTTCHGSTYFDTEISVYTGTCGSLTCRDGSDDGFCVINGGTPGVLKSSVNILSEASEQYYIYVNGNSGASGSFRIYVYNNTDELLANDQCINAQELTFGTGASATSANGSLNYATSIDAPEDCGDNVNNGDSEGLWYTFTGTGTNMLYNINTCSNTNFDTEISVFSGSCGSLTCLDGNDDNSSCGNSTRSSVDLVTTTIEPYYIYVKGNNGSVGKFRLKIENQNDRLPENDLCENATELIVPTGGTVDVDVTLGFASSIGAPPDCGIDVDNNDSGGIWYTFTAGAYRSYDIFTCSNETTFNTELSLFTGTCGSLSCVTGNDDAAGCLPNTVGYSYLEDIYQTTDTQYYLYLKGNQDATGDFELFISDETPDPLPTNDLCSTAEFVGLEWGADVSISSSTKYFDNTSSAPIDCGTGVDNSDASGLWYTFTGTGNRFYEISTCNAGNTLDTEISVFSGSCGSLTCIDGNDNDGSCSEGGGGTSSTVMFEASSSPDYSAVTYYIYVKGNAGNYGEFTLNIDDLSPENDICYQPRKITVPVGGSKTKSGTVAYASNYTSPVDCGTIDNSGEPGVWYWLNARRYTAYEITTCSPNTDFDTEITLLNHCFSSNCLSGNDDDPLCIEGSAGTSSRDTLFNTRSDEFWSYRIFVKGKEGATGDFDITVTEVYAPNNLCESAIHYDLPVGESITINDDLFFTTDEDFPGVCDGAGTDPSSGGKWYTFPSKAGRMYNLTLCSPETNTSGEIYVYTGDCNSLNCVGGADSGYCTFGAGKSTVTWTNDTGQDHDFTYVYVRKKGVNLGSRDFALEISDFTLPTNDLCDNSMALDLPLGGSISISDSIDFSTNETPTDDCISNLDYDTPGLWYHFSAKAGRTYQITTCNTETNFDTEMVVFAGTGGCDDYFECVGTNDDDPTCSVNSRRSTILWTNDLGFDSDFTRIYVKNYQGINGNFTLEIMDLSPLPAELTAFTGRPDGQVNLLEWETASEENTEWHIVERSPDGRIWQEIGRVAAAGESSVAMYYTFADQNPLPSAYYRLNTTDFDGSWGYSDVLFIERDAAQTKLNILEAFPMPFDNLLNITFHARTEERLTLSFFDIHGRLLRQEAIEALAGENRVQINLQDLPAGAYMLSLIGSEERANRRVLKSKR